MAKDDFYSLNNKNADFRRAEIIGANHGKIFTLKVF
jgi:hypothetical protein